MLPQTDGKLMRHRQILSSLAATVIGASAAFVPAAHAQGQTINVSDNHGGSVPAYDSRWAAHAARGASVRVVGPCQSACTILLGHIPRNRICVTPAARFGFHTANRQASTDMLWNAYGSDIKSWINARGGLTPAFKWMGAPDTYRYFKKC